MREKDIIKKINKFNVAKKYKLSCAVWETTLACNMNCTHCGSRAGTARPNELSTKECFNLCEQLADVNCDVVSLMGGEPFVRPDWFSIARCIRDLSMEVAWVSNGLLIQKNLDKIMSIKPQVIGISIDGLKQTHDNIRRDGSFDIAMKAIDLLRESGIQVTVITTVSQLNIAELPKIQQLLYPKNVNWQIQIAIPIGNFNPKYLISKDQYYKISEFVLKQNIQNRFNSMPVVGSHCLGYFSEKYLKRTKWNGCTAGISSIGITSQGNIVGCLSMGNDRFIEGNIRNQSFRQIWDDPDSFKYIRKFSSKDLGDNCRTCDYGDICKGGCSATSYSITQQFHNSPFCMRRFELEG